MKNQDSDSSQLSDAAISQVQCNSHITTNLLISSVWSNHLFSASLYALRRRRRWPDSSLTCYCCCCWPPHVHQNSRYRVCLFRDRCNNLS